MGKKNCFTPLSFHSSYLLARPLLRSRYGVTFVSFVVNISPLTPCNPSRTSKQ